VDQTATAENTSYNTNAQNAFNAAQTDTGDYASAVGAFKAANPYGQGGPVQTAQNQEVADTAAGQAQSAGNAIQSAAVRTGQNAGGAIAATENMQEQNDRALMGQEAADTAQTAGAGASYGAQVVGDTANVENMQQSLAQQQAAAAQGALGTEEQAAQTPSFLDELGQGLISAGGQFAGGYGQGLAKGCWVAAELYGGWNEPRAVAVRTWMFHVLHKKWWGWPLVELYVRVGERLANGIRKYPILRRVFLPIFNQALKAARNGR